MLAQEMQHFNIQQKQILELGCGIGLSSLLTNSRDADITPTDIHPLAGELLAGDVRLNQGRQIPFLRANFIALHALPFCKVMLVVPRWGNHASFGKKMVRLGFTHHQRKPQQDLKDKNVFKGQILFYQR